MAFCNRFSYLQHMLSRCTLGRMCMLPLHDDMPQSSQLHTGICFYKMHQRIPRNILKELFSNKLPKFYPSQKKRKTPTNYKRVRKITHIDPTLVTGIPDIQKLINRKKHASEKLQTKIKSNTDKFDMVQRNSIHGSIMYLDQQNKEFQTLISRTTGMHQ